MELTAVKNLSSGGGLKVDYGTVKTTVDMALSPQPLFTIQDAPILLILCEHSAGLGGAFYRLLPNTSSIVEAQKSWNKLNVNYGYFADSSSNVQGSLYRVGNTVYYTESGFSGKEITVHYALIS